MSVAKAQGLEKNERSHPEQSGRCTAVRGLGEWKSHSQKWSAISPNGVTVGVPANSFLLMAAVLMIAAIFLTGCMHRYSVCVPTNQGSMCMAGYTKAQAHKEWKTLYFFTDPEVVKTPKGVGKKTNTPVVPNDSGKPAGKPI